MQRLGLRSLLAVPRQQVFNAGKQVQGVLPRSAVSGVQRERAAALPGLRLTGTAVPSSTGTPQIVLKNWSCLTFEQPCYNDKFLNDGKDTLYTSHQNSEHFTSATNCHLCLLHTPV